MGKEYRDAILRVDQMNIPSDQKTALYFLLTSTRYLKEKKVNVLEESYDSVVDTYLISEIAVV